MDSVSRAEASLLNLSLSGPPDRLLDSLIDAVIEKGVFVVAAFDPKRPNSERFPTRRNGVLIVRAENMDQENNTEFAAPGRRIVSSPSHNYQYMAGHSVATAYTSGVLALLIQSQSQTRSDLSDALVDTQGRARYLSMHQLLENWHSKLVTDRG